MASVASASAASPTGIYSGFKYCPYTNSAVANCLRSVSTSGSFKLGNASVPVSAPITFQGGFTVGPTFSTTFFPAVGADTLSKTPLDVPGGLLGLVNPGGFGGLLEQAFENAIHSANGVTATAELAGTPQFSYLAFLTANGPTVTLPIRVHLQNPFLGPDCYIGSSSNPITLRLTVGTTTPPAGTAPITGSQGSISTDDNSTVLTADGVTLVDNAFSVPAASNCGYLPLDKLLITGAVNLREGLPSAAGNNSASLSGQTQVGVASAVAASVH
ncbi:MAG TPA: hypothetical protein VI318_13860 [Baekduia sp.]